MTFFDIALPLILLIPLTAQDTRIVTGTVRNQEGRPLAGAVVQMMNLDSQQSLVKCYQERRNIPVRSGRICSRLPVTEPTSLRLRQEQRMANLTSRECGP